VYGLGVLVALVVLGALGYQLGQKKDRALEGLLLGGLLGVLGLVILYFLKPKETAAAQTWGTASGYGAPAQTAYGQQASYGYGQASVLPGVGSTAPTANPYAPLAETVGYGYEQPVAVAQPAQPEPVAQAVAAQWFADPSGRHQHRYWDGNAWTEHVADNGVVSVDAPLPAQPF
jgi:hypothetical protein